MTLLYAVAGAIALALLAYLFVAMFNILFYFTVIL